MPRTQSFLEVARDLVDDPAAKAAYAADPAGFLAERGFDGLAPEDVDDAVGLVADALPAPLALQLAGDPEDAVGDGLLGRLAALEPEAPAPEPVPMGVDVASLPDPTGPIDLGAARAPAPGPAVHVADAAAMEGTAAEGMGLDEVSDSDIEAASGEEEPVLDDASDVDGAGDPGSVDGAFGTGAPVSSDAEGVVDDATGAADEDESDEPDVLAVDVHDDSTAPGSEASEAAPELPPAPEPPPPDEPDEIEEMI